MIWSPAHSLYQIFQLAPLRGILLPRQLSGQLRLTEAEAQINEVNLCH